MKPRKERTECAPPNGRFHTAEEVRASQEAAREAAEDGNAYVRLADDRGGIALSAYLLDGLTSLGHLKLVRLIADVSRFGPSGNPLGLFFAVRPRCLYEVRTNSGNVWWCTNRRGVVYPVSYRDAFAASLTASRARGELWEYCRVCQTLFRGANRGELTCGRCAKSF